MTERASTFLMFYGQAEEALTLYREVFESIEMGPVEKYGPETEEMNGKIKRAALRLGGQRLMLIDSPAVHDFGFTPAISIFVDCDSDTDIVEKFDALSADGQIFMPLDNYGFSQRFAWVADKFGVSWQLNLPDAPRA